MRNVPLHLVLALACAVVACSDRTPARIAFATDTIHVNSTLWTDPGVTAVNAAGTPLANASIALRATPESLVVVSPSGKEIRCLDDGIGRIEARVDALYAARSVECRPTAARGNSTLPGRAGSR